LHKFIFAETLIKMIVFNYHHESHFTGDQKDKSMVLLLTNVGQQHYRSKP